MMSKSDGNGCKSAVQLARLESSTSENNNVDLYSTGGPNRNSKYLSVHKLVEARTSSSLVSTSLVNSSSSTYHNSSKVGATSTTLPSSSSFPAGQSFQTTTTSPSVTITSTTKILPVAATSTSKLNDSADLLNQLAAAASTLAPSGREYSQPFTSPPSSQSHTAKNTHSNLKNSSQMTMYSIQAPSGPFSLQMGPNVSAYPFVNQAFKVPLFLYDGNRELVQGYEIPVIAELFYQQGDTALASAEDICTLDPNPVVIGPLGVVEVNCRFAQLSMQHSNRKFVWKFSIRLSTLQQRLSVTTTGSGGTNHQSANLSSSLSSSAANDNSNTNSTSSSSSADDTNDTFISILTPAFLVVRQRLRISVSSGCNAQLAQAAELLASGGDDWKTTALSNPTIHNILSNTSNGHIIWYKDEGGKDHGLDVTVTLVDANSEPSSSQPIAVGEKDDHASDANTDEFKPVVGQEIPFLFNLVYSNGDSILGCSSLPTSRSTLSNHHHNMSNTNNSSNNNNNSALANIMSGASGNNVGILGATNSVLSSASSSNALFSILPDGNLCFIDKTTGKTSPRLKIRIHDISKNHQRQLFRLKVTPDIAQCPGLFDVAGDESVAIEVRSKRTKRQRDALIMLMQQQQLQLLQQTQQQQQGLKTSMSGSSLVLLSSPKQPEDYNNANLVESEEDESADSYHHPTTKAMANNIRNTHNTAAAGHIKSNATITSTTTTTVNSNSVLKKRASELQLVADYNNTYSNSDNNNNNNNDNNSHLDGNAAPTNKKARNSLKSSTTNHSTSDTVPAIPAGMDSEVWSQVLRWMQQTYDTLHHIRWTPLGYLPDAHGHIDNRQPPLYQMVNPNAFIEPLLQEFAQHILPVLFPQHPHVPMLLAAAAAATAANHHQTNHHTSGNTNSTAAAGGVGTNNSNNNNTTANTNTINTNNIPVNHNNNNNNNNNGNGNGNGNGANVPKIRTKKFGKVGRDVSPSTTTTTNNNNNNNNNTITDHTTAPSTTNNAATYPHNNGSNHYPYNTNVTPPAMYNNHNNNSFNINHNTNSNVPFIYPNTPTAPAASSYPHLHHPLLPPPPYPPLMNHHHHLNNSSNNNSYNNQNNHNNAMHTTMYNSNTANSAMVYPPNSHQQQPPPSQHPHPQAQHPNLPSYHPAATVPASYWPLATSYYNNNNNNNNSHNTMPPPSSNNNNTNTSTQRRKPIINNNNNSTTNTTTTTSKSNSSATTKEHAHLPVDGDEYGPDTSNNNSNNNNARNKSSRSDIIRSSNSNNSNSSANHSEEERRVFYIVSTAFRLPEEETTRNHNNNNNHNNVVNSSSSSSNEFYSQFPLQIPAYDAQAQLVGFYSETKDARNATIILFTPVASCIYVTHNKNKTNHSDSDNSKDDDNEGYSVQYIQEHARVLYEKVQNARPEDIFALSRAEYDLETMKQDAMVHFWFAEVGLADEF